MKPLEIMRRMPLWYMDGISIHLEGPPGVGKSSVIEAAPQIIAPKMGWSSDEFGVMVINGAMLTPLHVLGYGVAKHFETHTQMLFSDPFFFVTPEGKRITEYKGGIIFVDEHDKCDPDTKKVLGEGRLSQRFGPHKLPKGWYVWSAGNRGKDRSGSTKKFDHEINRYQHVDYHVDVESWTEWAATQEVTPLTISFANAFPQIVFTDEVPKEQGPWCTPRSLCSADRYMRLLAQEFGRFPDDPITVEEIAGRIGASAVMQYFAHVKLEREMPKYEEIVAKPDKVKVPEKPDAQMLVCYNLAHRVKKEDAGPVIKYMERMPKEFATTFAKTAIKRGGVELLTTDAFKEWTKKNSALVAMMTLLSA